MRERERERDRERERERDAGSPCCTCTLIHFHVSCSHTKKELRAEECGYNYSRLRDAVVDFYLKMSVNYYSFSM